MITSSPTLHQSTAEAVARLQSELASLPSRQRLSDEDTEAIYALAYHALGQGHLDSAFRYFSLLTLYRPTTVAYLGGLALTHKLCRRYAEAIHAYAFMASLAPQEPAHMLAMAECLLLSGAYEEAQATLDLVKRFCIEQDAHPRARAQAEALQDLLKSGARSA